MIRGSLLVLLVAAACRGRALTDELFVGVGASGLPGAGVGVSAGQSFARSERTDFAFELGGDFQDVRKGDFFQVRMGVKQSLRPGRPGHPVFRYGATWLRATGEPDLLRLPGDYFGAYAGAGWEWRLRERLRAGPEIRIVAVNGEGGLDTEVFAQVAFHLLFRF